MVQTAVKLALESIFEADFTDDAHGYRPRRSAQQAVRAVHKALKAGHVHVVDADLSQYFDTIPHAELMRSVARRVSDGSILHLIKMWLKAPVEEKSDDGKPTRRRSGNRGTPQGGVLSPLLANIYMRRFLKAWRQFGCDHCFGSRIVNYADDFVILCRRDAAGALSAARHILAVVHIADPIRVRRIVRRKLAQHPPAQGVVGIAHQDGVAAVLHLGQPVELVIEVLPAVLIDRQIARRVIRQQVAVDRGILIRGVDRAVRERLPRTVNVRLAVAEQIEPALFVNCGLGVGRRDQPIQVVHRERAIVGGKRAHPAGALRQRLPARSCV